MLVLISLLPLSWFIPGSPLPTYSILWPTFIGIKTMSVREERGSGFGKSRAGILHRCLDMKSLGQSVCPLGDVVGMGVCMYL